MHFRTEIRGTYKLKIGEGTIIGDNALLDARSGLYIGKMLIYLLMYPYIHYNIIIGVRTLDVILIRI